VTRYRLTLYVSGTSQLSLRAIAGAKAFCEHVLPGHYDLTVLDLETHAPSATADGVMATPTLVLNEPPPSRRIIGDLSSVGSITRALGLETA
jgi:circadian clock protein KaiB